MNNIRLFKSAKFTLCSFHPRFSSVFSRSKQNERLHRNLQLATNKNFTYCTFLKQFRSISNFSSMQKKDSDSPLNGKGNDNYTQKALEDEDFQSILRDFANDFGVDSSTDEILEDIRKSIDETYEDQERKGKNNNIIHHSLDSGLVQKFKEFSDVDAVAIPSHEESYNAFEETDHFYHVDQELAASSYYDQKRGVTGVFDLHELIEVLRKENVVDITAISVPPELHYTDYLVLATAKSQRHNEAVAELVIKLYKKKKNKKDPFVIVEGENVSSWKVIDMRNIVLHLFLEETRQLYDLESLWLVDSKFDSGGNIPEDPMLKIIEEQMSFFNSLQKDDSNKDS